MADTVTKQKRSEIMRAIKNKDSKIERRLRKELSRIGLKYRKNVSSLKGKPDLVFKKDKVVVFLDSCFWHGCRWHCRLPRTNRVYWRTKIANNKKRDKKTNKIYKKIGWKILRFWEHEINNNFAKVIREIENSLNK